MHPQDLDGQVAIVTGGGLGIARRLAGVGAILADLSFAAAEQAATAMEKDGLKAAPLAMDVSDEAMVDAGVAEIAAHFGRVDIRVSNAGIQTVHPIQDYPWKPIRQRPCPARKHAKSEAWWALAQDRRRAILEEQSRHIAIGMEYLPAIARRLHHGRELGEPPISSPGSNSCPSMRRPSRRFCCGCAPRPKGASWSARWMCV
jgi:enoyl-[acyl-carrier-protein] reductase (NADH)